MVAASGTVPACGFAGFAGLAGLAAGWLIERRVPPMPLITTSLLLVFGGLTLWLADETFIAERVDGLADFRALVAGWSPERAAAISGVPAGDIRRAARLYATTRPAMCVAWRKTDLLLSPQSA